MFLEKWMIYALSAAMLWGASYAACGPTLRAGMPPVIFYFCYSFLGFLTALLLLITRGNLGEIGIHISKLGTNKAWFLFSLLAASLGALMTYLAIGEKNATLASLVEISYPLFVVFFTWVFFQEIEINMITAAGAFLVISGVSLIFWSTR